MLDFTLLTPALSSRRGSVVLLQPIVFIMKKSCVDTYALEYAVCTVDYLKTCIAYLAVNRHERD
jgi:hypothetical protein